MGLKSSWLKSLGLKGPGLKLGVEKSRVEMSFNNSNGLEEIQSKNSSTLEIPVLVIRGAIKSYGSKKNTNIVIQDLNMDISQGTM